MGSRTRGDVSVGRWLTLCGLVMSLAVCCTAVRADDWPGPPPEGTFAADILIVVDNGYKVGRLVNVEVAGDASDTDIREEDCEEVSDTFNAADAYKWVITDLAATTPLNLTGKTVSFKTNNDLGFGHVAMKVKDDGAYAQDFNDHTQVASIKVTIVDPDNIRIVSQNGAITVNDAVKVRCETPVVWQLTYSGQDLPWAGDVQEQITWPLDRHRNVSPATPQAVTGTFADTASWTCTNEGRFTDDHLTDFAKPLPSAGTFHVAANKQKFKNLEAAGTPLFGDTFTDYEYIDSTPTFTHDESS